MTRGTYFARKDKDTELRGFLPDTFPVGIMDDATKAQLEEVRLRTPRYLFRVWNNSGDENTSGGELNLNTVDAIVPSAFRHGLGHSSVYDFRREDFRDMVSAHILNYGPYESDYGTELSSWCGSLSWAISFAFDCRGGDMNECHVSVIDTRALWHHNQIFFVPDLSFLGHDLRALHFEYLAHGVIRGPHHHAVPLSTIGDRGFDLNEIAHFNHEYISDKAQAITAKAVENAQRVGAFFGTDLALPMTLALLCMERRQLSLFGKDKKEMRIILDGLAGVQFPHDWINDSTIMREVVFTGDGVQEHYPDLRQFIELMRAIAIHKTGRGTNEDLEGTRKPLLKIGGQSKANGVTFHAGQEVKYIYEDHDHGNGEQQQSEVSSGHSKRGRKRRADADEEMQDVEGQTLEPRRSKRLAKGD